MLTEEYILPNGTQSWREKSGSLWQKGICHKACFLVLGGPTSCHFCPASESSRAHPPSGTVNSGLSLSSLAEAGTGPWAVGWGGGGQLLQKLRNCWVAQVHALGGVFVLSLILPLPPSPETSDVATTSIEDDERWGPGSWRGGSKGGCCSCQAITRLTPWLRAECLKTEFPHQQS